MFIVKDCTRNPPYTTASNDIKDVRDIVIGITGNERIGDHVLLHLGHMTFGQFLVWGQSFMSICRFEIRARRILGRRKMV